jgi:dolichol-phosphate mannosyltransferase
MNVDLTCDIRELPGPILVIGANGFIGANLLRTLLEARDDVFGTLKSGGAWRIEGLPSSQLPFMDILDSSGVECVLDRIQPKVIFHCAAFGCYSFQQDHSLIHRTNYLALIHLLELLSQRSIAAFIHAGSSSEYGLNSAAPFEADQMLPNSHYAVSKAAASQVITYYGKVRGVPCVNLRLYSVYGPYEDSSRLIPTLSFHIHNGKLPPFVSPDTTRDFVHVADVSRAFIMAAKSMSPEKYGESYNIGTGRMTSISDLATVSRSLFSIEEQPRFNAIQGRDWDVSVWRCNADKAARSLGWTPSISFETGLRQTVAWWGEFLTTHEFEDLTKKERERTDKNTISAVIACYKDGQAIPIMYERLVKVFRKCEIEYEIIFVNDCSPDDTVERLQEITSVDPCVIGITHSRNFGSQAAFRSGMEMATKEACVLLDGDLQDPPELIESFIAKWREGYDVVYGRRVKRDMPPGQEVLYKLFYRIFALASEIPIPKDAGDFSLIDARVMRWILRCDERDSFLRGLRAYVGFRQTGIDYIRPERMFGRSTNNLHKNIGWAKKGIFSFSRAPLTILTEIGFILFGFSLVLSAVTFLLKLFVPDIAPHGITTTILLILFFGSLNVLGIGILGEYMGKIMEETKGRPAFIRSSVIRKGKVSHLPEKT